MKHQYIEINGRTFFECGYQYGFQAKDKIKAGVADYKDTFSTTYRKSWEEIQEMAMKFAPYLEKELPDVMDEIKGIAAGSDCSLADIMVLNVRYELTKMPRPHECTVSAIMPEASKEGGTIMAKNWDYRVGILENVVILHITEPDGSRIIGIAEAGQVMRDGINTAGIGIVNSNLTSAKDTLDEGVPSCFIRRRVLSSKSFEEACDYIRNVKRSVSCNMMVVSADGRAVDFEVQPDAADEIVPEKGILTHANHFIVHPEIQILEKSKRDERLRELYMERYGKLDVDAVKFCYSDHKNYPQCLCRHPHDASIPRAKRTITVANEIYDFKNGEAHFCQGPPCTGEYVCYKL